MKVYFKHWGCVAKGSHYMSNNNKSISLIDKEDGGPVATATTNLVEETIPTDVVFIKDYSENEGMAESLIKAGIIEPEVVSTVGQTFVKINAYKLTARALKKLWEE